MLHPKDSAQYAGVITEVVTDFTKKIENERRSSPTGDLIPDIANELYLFSLEGKNETNSNDPVSNYSVLNIFFFPPWTGISSILFETRLGCLEKEIPAGTREFIQSIAQMFSNSMAVVITPKWSRSLLPYWGRYIAGWEGIFTFGERDSIKGTYKDKVRYGMLC